MPRFFIGQEQITNGIITLTGDDARHISRSLRMAPGESVTLCDMRGNDYACVLERFTPDTVEARILSVSPSAGEPPFRVHLYQALPKGDKLDLIIQKAVECGVTEITPFESEHCIVKIKADVEDKKTERRQRIALEAAKQCGRGIVPCVHPAISFAQMLASAAKAQLPLFCYEGDGTRSLKEILRTCPLPHFGEQGSGRPEISVVIGSEGGFSPAEANAAHDAGMNLTGLGPRILRTETASGLVLACLSYEWEL